MEESDNLVLSKFRILGIDIFNFTRETLIGTISINIKSKNKIIIANHNLHSVFIFRKDQKFREFYYLAQYVHVDGMSLIWLAKLAGFKLNRTNRLTYLDWIWDLFHISDLNAYRIFYLGSKPGVAEKSIGIIKNKYPRVEITSHHGYFNKTKKSSENNEVIRLINSFSPDILMVGMGMPAQEKWILDNFEQINTKIILNSGACFDYIAGEKPTPPRGWSKLGLEWLFRLSSEPKRLFFRYLVEPLLLIPFIIASIIKTRFKH